MNPLENYPDTSIDRMRDNAWRRAAHSWAEIRQHCSQHGSGGHTEICLMLGASARSDDQTWHTLMVESARRHAARGNTNSNPYLLPQALERTADAHGT